MSAVVLVVDDDPVQRRLIEAMVSRFGYRPMLAEGGDAAVRILTGPQGPSIDCLVLDLVMPVTDGWMFLRERNSNPELEAIPVIVLSGQPGVEEQVIAAHASYLAKPLSPERLTEMMHQVMR